MRLCFWSGHSHGRYSGSTWYADQHWDELERRCAVHVNVDSTGGVGAMVLENAAAAPELLALAGEAIGEQAGAEYVGKRMSRSSDQSFWGIGIPAMFGALSEQPPAPVKMRNALGWWWHTPHDTLDKIDESEPGARHQGVRAHAVAAAVRPGVAAGFRHACARAAGGVGRACVRRWTERFSLEGWSPRPRRCATRRRPAGIDDAALMRASRALAPVYYTSGDRFAHDPALPLPAWPVLQPLRDLAKSAPRHRTAAHALTVSATRARNRMLHALREATEALGN